MRVVLVSFPVTMMNYLIKISLGEGLIFSSWFLATTHHCRDCHSNWTLGELATLYAQSRAERWASVHASHSVQSLAQAMASCYVQGGTSHLN